MSKGLLLHKRDEILSSVAGTGLPIKPFTFTTDKAEADGALAVNGDEGHTDRVEALLGLRPEVRKRVCALRKLQLDAAKEMHKLECKFAAKYADLNERRRQIINGEIEPTVEESNFELFPSSEDVLKVQFDEQLKLQKAPEGEPAKGIPDFWLSVLKNHDCIADAIQEQDEPILKYLTDIKVELIEEPMGFKLHFHFSPNPYFKNTVLTKEYHMKCEMDPERPADFDGAEIVKSTGCTIDWLPNQDVTVRTVKRKQKKKGGGNQPPRYVTKQVKTESFFNFFSPPATYPDCQYEDMDDQDRNMLQMDFEMGQILRDNVVPYALFHFTQEMEEEDDEFDDEDEDLEDEESDEGGADA